jgi:hypothetical protein
MSSIFIWKASEPNTSKKTIRYYSGSNWALEDNEFASKSYMFLEQIVIPGFNDSVITYRAKVMPQDWVGSELLEVSHVPYEHIKSDNYGTLEKIGDWMRFISKQEIEFDEDTLQTELETIKDWMSEKKSHIPTQKKFQHEQRPLTQQNVQLNFQEFLIKYSFDNIQNSSVVVPSTDNTSNYKKPYSKNNKFVKNNGKSYLNSNKQATKAY